MQISISSQEEYDKAVKSKQHLGNELIIQNTPDFIHIHTDVTVGKDGRCKTDNKSQITITAKENGIVAAEGKTTVIGYDNANIIAKGNCKIDLNESAIANCYEHCNITVKGKAKVNADGNCTVTAFDESTVSASGSSKVYTSNNATARGTDVTTLSGQDASTLHGLKKCTILAKDTCIVYASDECTVQAADNVLVVANKNAKITSQDNCLVMSKDNPNITLTDQCEHLNLDNVTDKNIMGALKQMAQSKTVIERPLVAIQILKENIPTTKQEAVNKRLNTMGLKDQTAIVKHMKGLVEAMPASVQKNQNTTLSFEKQLELAHKAGYIQGVCECVAAVAEEKNLGKKLLTEMNVTKDVAKKFANPETYKTLEQGIFAQKQEHKLEQMQGVKR